jgi:hypothetical protein
VLLPADWCWTDGAAQRQQPESAKLRCNFESIFPATASGYGRLRHTVRLKIKSSPGTDGTIVVDATMESTESDPADNTAAIVITGTGGEGGSLPVTGPSTGLLAGAGTGMVVLGAALYLLSPPSPGGTGDAARLTHRSTRAVDLVVHGSHCCHQGTGSCLAPRTTE